MQLPLLLKNISELLRAKGCTLATAESCTGGMISAAITSLSGSSDVFDRGFVTYSNASKMELLGVLPETLNSVGAVSEETAQQMVIGALVHSHADYAVVTTGIAGPTGGTDEKPVGLVYIGIGKRSSMPLVTKHLFTGDRDTVRQKTVEAALSGLLGVLHNERQ